MKTTHVQMPRKHRTKTSLYVLFHSFAVPLSLFGLVPVAPRAVHASERTVKTVPWASRRTASETEITLHLLTGAREPTSDFAVAIVCVAGGEGRAAPFVTRRHRFYYVTVSCAGDVMCDHRPGLFHLQKPLGRVESAATHAKVCPRFVVSRSLKSPVIETTTKNWAFILHRFSIGGSGLVGENLVGNGKGAGDWNRLVVTVLCCKRVVLLVLCASSKMVYC